MKQTVGTLLVLVMAVIVLGCPSPTDSSLDTPPGSQKAITSFVFASVPAAGAIYEASHTIAVTVFFGTDLTALVPTIAHTGASISPASGVARDFSVPVIYTVTAADGSTRGYVVTVTKPSGLKIVDSTGTVGRHGSIAVHGSDVYISYFDGHPNNNLKFARSTDGGATWLAAAIRTVDSVGDVGRATSIAVNGSNVYISYFDGTNNSLKFARSTDAGATWPTAAIKTVDASQGEVVGYPTSIVVSGSDVYLAYYEALSVKLKFTRSTDGGTTWPAANIKFVDPADNVGSSLSLAFDNSVAKLYVSYHDSLNYDLKFARSTDGGATWPEASIRIVDSTGQVGRYASIAASGDNVYTSYYDETNKDLKFARSTDGGTTWPAASIRTVDSAGDVGLYTSIAASGSYVYISYVDATNGNLKFARSTDGGATWPTAAITTVDSGGYVGLDTSIAVSGSNLYVSYMDSTNGDLRFARSIDNGASW